MKLIVTKNSDNFDDALPTPLGICLISTMFWHPFFVSKMRKERSTFKVSVVGLEECERIPHRSPLHSDSGQKEKGNKMIDVQ